ncbi:hypothetical protein BX616_001769 [Lobosporangium transversale]|nr:hypothetical protein BX616_001769 [Lobosporangium transversale]
MIVNHHRQLSIQAKGVPKDHSTDAVTKAATLGFAGVGHEDYIDEINHEEDIEHVEGFYDDDTTSENELRQASMVAWAETSGNGSDVIAQSSDDYGDDMDDGQDDEDDELEDDDDNLSEDTADTDDLVENQGKNDHHYNRPIHHGPYPKSRRQVEQFRRNQNRTSVLRKSRLRLRTISSAGTHTDSAAKPGINSVLNQDGISEDSPSRQAFVQTCDDVALMLRQGPLQHGLEIIYRWITHAIDRRRSGEIPPGCLQTAEQLQLLEGIYFSTWAKELLERRPSSNNSPIVLYLKAYLQLGSLIIQQDNTLPEPYAQIMSAMFEQDYLEVHKRNSKRPSRLMHLERISHFDVYSTEYPPEDDEVPQLQQDFQRSFSIFGGLEACIHAIEVHMESSECAEVKLRNLLLLLGLVSRPCCSSQIPVSAGDSDQSQFSKLTGYSRRLMTTVLGYFPDHNDSFRSMSKASVQDVISFVGIFLLENYRIQAHQSHTNQEIDEGYEDFDPSDPVSRSNLGEVKFADFRLEMAVRLMKTSRLDLRLAGLAELKEVLLRIQRLQHGRPRLRRRSDTDMDAHMDTDRKPIEHLCLRLQSMNIVACIFGSNIHLEIVQRSTDVLVFMVHARVLTANDIDLIWAAAGENQHRSIVYGVYQVLGELSSKLPHDFLKSLFQKLQAVHLANWDQQLLDLSRSLFNAIVQRSRSGPEDGSISLIPYETLLNVLRNSTPSLNTREDPSLVSVPSNRDVIGGIAYLLKEGLGVGPSPQDCAHLIELCIQDLKKNHPGAIWSLQVIQSVFESHFPNGENEGLLFYEQSCASLSDLFIANLKAYTLALKTLPPTPSPTVSAFLPLSTLQNSQDYWRGQQLKIRLDFLKVMARLYPVYWNSSDLADTLWSSLIVDPIGIQEQDEAFICLESMNEPHFVEYVYEKLLPTLEIARITQRAWHCVQRYFLLLNWNKGKLIASDMSNDNSPAFVVLASLYGMDLIWEIALHAQTPTVGTYAIDFLSSLIRAHPRQIESPVPEEIYKFREGLVETCVDHLVKSSDQLSSSDNMNMLDVSLVFERCIGTLKAFLMACSSERVDSAARPEMHGTLDEEAMLTIRVNSGINFQVSVHPSGTLASLRRAVANKLHCSDQEEVRLFSLGKDFSMAWDGRTLEELQVENGQSFLASKRTIPSTSTHSVETDKKLPIDLLLMPDFFERVRQIFLLDEKYAAQAWEVVIRLPTSPVLIRSFEQLQDGLDWTTLMDARSPFLLLYSLQIINSMVKRDQGSQDQTNQQWIRRFVNLGGQKYLTTLLMSDSGLGATNSSLTSRKALALMLKVLVRLTNSSETEFGRATDTDGVTAATFLNRLVSEILTSASREDGSNPNDQSIVLNAATLISHLCTGPMGWHHFHTGPDVRSLIFISMVQSDSTPIRETVLDMGRRFCLQVRDIQPSDVPPVMFFLDIIQSFLPVSKEYEGNCSELFEFFEIIAREAIHYCTEEYYSALYSRLLRIIMEHPSSEDISLSNEDTVLLGMLKVATAMISTEPKLKHQVVDFTVIDYIFDECLFPQSPNAQSLDHPTMPTMAKCQSEGSRSAAFGLLEEYARGEPEILRHVITKTRLLFDRGLEMEDQWGYDPQLTKRASCGFVGLQNLGATCYVNSLMQQFYMNKEFRYGILDAPIDEMEADKHDTLLYQLQVLFGNLQESIRRAYNAYGFCYAYKDWDGNPMNVAVQMDVDEFFSILFDRLENSVKSTPQEELFKKQYGGKLVQQIKSKDCEHVSQREDSFFSIQCEVKNKKSLEESLQLYVQGEILDGDNKYKCSSCDKHVDAIKRACIKELPQNLILHLKRFDYDMDTMRRIKINDHFEFPMRLDMEPYTLDYLARKEQVQEGGSASPSTQPISGNSNAAAFQYNLVGVLVHTGTADSGHYYSYIKDRERNSFGSENERWYFFNDSRVEEFDPSDIPAKAFGGTEFIPMDASPYLKSQSRSTTKPYSAYMLFYERSDIVPSASDIVSSGVVPADIRHGVIKENTSLLKDLAVFDRQYYRFVWDLFNLYKTTSTPVGNGDSATDSLDFLSMQYGLDFFFYVLIHARDVDQELQQWTRFLPSLLVLYPSKCATFIRSLADNQTLLASVLLACPITQVREAVIDLIYEALHGLRGESRHDYGLIEWANFKTSEMETQVADRDKSNGDGWMCAQGSPICRLITTLLQILPEARANWRNFDEYFKLLYNITQLGRAERIFMVREGYISELIDLYTYDERNDSKKKKMGDKFTKPSFRYLILTVHELVTTCDVIRSYEALERDQEQRIAHGRSGSQVSRKSSTSSASTSSATSSLSSEDVNEDIVRDPNESPELDNIAILSRADLNALFSSHAPHGNPERSPFLISKMIQDHIDTAIIARLVSHLSSHHGLGNRLLGSLSTALNYANEDQFSVIIQIFKELVLFEDDQLENRVEFILMQLVKVLDHTPQHSVAYDCLDFFRTISDYGQCGRLAQAWLLRNSRAWLQELLLMQNDSETRLRARLFYMELLSSERAFNGWNDQEAAEAQTRHFEELLQLMGAIPELLAYYPDHMRKDDDPDGWKLVEYFKALTELVRSDAERIKFTPSWKLFIDILSKIDSEQIKLDYDKKEMMIFWEKIMTENQELNMRLASYKPLGTLLRKFFVCLQPNPTNLQFHRETLPIYFGLVLRFSRLQPAFHTEWVHCHNFTWALGAMKWGVFTQYCPRELDELLVFTLSEFPPYRQECWRALSAPDTPRFYAQFMQIARAMFEAENEMAGALFYQHRGLVHLTEIIQKGDQPEANEDEFFAVDALVLLSDYLCRMTVCRNTAAFAEAMDHWSNIYIAIKILMGNLMWTAPFNVYTASVTILTVIASEATESQAASILDLLDKAHHELRDSVLEAEIQTCFGGPNSPYTQYGVLESRPAIPNVRSPPMRIGPLIVMHSELYKRLGDTAAKQVLDEWFMPYWTMARAACSLADGHENQKKSIDLAALMALEQLDVGCLLHMDVLCEAIVNADNADKLLLFKNSNVALFMKRFLKREKYLTSLNESSRLSACALLLKAIDLEQSFRKSIADESFTKAEHVLKRIVVLEESQSGYKDQQQARDSDMNSDMDNNNGPPLAPDQDCQDLIIALQNIVILDIDARDEISEDSARLRRLQENIYEALPRVPEKYSSSMSRFLPVPPTTTSSNVLKPVENQDASGNNSGAEDPSVMTGITG